MEPKACWILCTPRTGSTLLCELLNNLGSFPKFEHPKLDQCKGLLKKAGGSFNEWIRLYSNPIEFMACPPPYCKMIFHQYVEVMASVEKCDKYNVGWYPNKHSKEIEDKAMKIGGVDFVKLVFPDLRFIHLRRKPVTQAVSLFIARNTKKYHLYNQYEVSEYLKMRVGSDDEQLLAAYKDACENNRVWDKFLEKENAIEVDYQELVDDTTSVMDRLASQLNLKGNIVKAINSTMNYSSKVKRMTRPEANELTERLEFLLNDSKQNT